MSLHAPFKEHIFSRSTRPLESQFTKDNSAQMEHVLLSFLFKNNEHAVKILKKAPKTLVQTTSKTIRVCGRRSCLGGAPPLLAGRNRERDDRDDNDAVATD